MRTSIRASSFAFALVLAYALSALSIGAQPAAIDPQSPIPFDAAVHRGTLPNGMQFFIRRNARPANRVLLRLAVKAGSLDETDDQQGLAHVLEHMAVNGSEHFQPGH